MATGNDVHTPPACAARHWWYGWYGLAASLLLMTTVVMVAFTTTRATLAVAQSRRLTFDRLRALEHYKIALRAAESGQRGYLLTSRDEYLAPYRDALRRIVTARHALAALGMPTAALDAAVDRKRAELRETVQLAQAGRVAEAVAVVRGGDGLRQMEDIRRRVADHEDALAADMARDDARLAWRSQLALVAIPGAGVVGAGLIVSAFAALRAELARRRVVEAALRASESRFRSLAETACDAIILVDATGTIVYCNDAATRVLGFARDELKDHPLVTIIPASHRAGFARFVAAGRDNLPGVTATRVGLRRDGTEFPVEISLGSWADDDGRRYVTAILRDVTDRHDAEQALRRSNADLEQFAYAASHDLQEPLRIIASFAQLLQERYRGQLDAKADGWLLRIVDGARRMRMMIDDLLTYARLTTRGENTGVVSLHAAATAVCAGLQQRIAETDAVVDIAAMPAVVADGSQVAMALQNLFLNALKYRHPLRAPHVRVDAFVERGMVVVAVHDNGVGIAPQHHGKIFEMFTRVGTSGERGTGLGLAIVRRIAERHGGRAWVESVPDTGSIFYFTLPAAATGSLS